MIPCQSLGQEDDATSLTPSSAHKIVPDKPGFIYVHVCHADDGRDPQALADDPLFPFFSPQICAVRRQQPGVLRESTKCVSVTKAQDLGKRSTNGQEEN